MNKHITVPNGAEQWLINLIELKNRSDKSLKQIAESENLAEKSVVNVFTGKSKSPGVDLVRRIIHSLGGSWAEIFGESGAVIGGQDLATLETQNAELTHELDVCQANVEILTIENKVLSDKVAALENEKHLLALRLEYEQKLNAVHSYYTKKSEN